MKKFSISSEELKKALKKVGQAVNPSSRLPVTKNIFCNVTKSGVELICTDLEITISYKCEIEDKEEIEEFSILLPYDFIQKIVAVVPDGKFTIEHPSARKARILFEDDVYEIKSLDKLEDFPKLPDTPKKNTLQMDKDFINVIARALLTVSKDNLRPSMSRVLVDIKENEAFVVSTDAHHLFRQKLTIVSAVPEQIQFSRKMVKAIEGMDEIQLSWTKDRVALKNDIITVWCRLYDDKYPQYNMVIPDYPANTELTKSDLASALHKAMISNNSAGQIALHLKKMIGFISFESMDDDRERTITGKVAADYSGELELIALNAKKLLTVLDQATAENLKLHIHSASKAVLLTSDEDPNYLGLVMPLVA